MTGHDETWIGARDEHASGRQPDRLDDSLFFNDEAVDEATLARNRSRPVLHDPYYDDHHDDDSYRAGRGARVRASMASDWDESSQDELFIDRSGPNRILVFAVAALFAAVIGIALAGYNTFLGRGDASTADANGTVSDDGVDDEAGVLGSGDAATSDDSALPLDTTVPAAVDGGLTIQLVDSNFVCDDEVREFGRISGAEPNEAINFTSPQSEGLSAGQADANGELPIRWKCAPDQVGTAWELTATGATSGLFATTVFTGVHPNGKVELGPLAVDVVENPFVCDETVRVFATLSGASANAQIDFTSPQATGLRAGTTDAEGRLPIRWSCDQTQTGNIWELTATETATGRQVTFSFTGL